MKLTTTRKILIGAYSGYGKSVLGDWITKQYANNGIKVVVYNTDYEDTLKEGENIIVFNPESTKADNLKYLNGIIRKLRIASNFMLFIKDLDRFFDSDSQSSKQAKELKDLMSSGRHQRVGLIAEIKQFKYIPKKIISGANLIFFGSFSEVDDLQRLKNFATKKEISELKSPNFICYDRDTLERFVCHVDMQRGVLVKDRQLPTLSELIK